MTLHTLILSAVLPLLGDGTYTVSGRATIYWPGDGYNAGERADGKRFRRRDFHIAHRWLPLGTRGWLCGRRGCAPVVVRDRGPYGVLQRCPREAAACERRRGTAQCRRIIWERSCHLWMAQTRRRVGWRYRGEFDLTRPVARALGHRAFERLTFYWLPRRLVG